MSNMFSYVRWRGDISFKMLPLNEVDNLILSALAYVRMEGLVGGDFSNSVSIKELRVRYDEAGYDQSKMTIDPAVILRAIDGCERFRDVRVCGYENIVDDERELQFSASVFLLPDDTAYIAFRGTDDTVTGWKENINFSLGEATLGQKMSAEYVNQAAAKIDRPLYIGGHSKGGNFAVFGAAFCDETVKERIKKVYSNDGPGFHHAITSKEAYQNILKKVELIIPEESLVGMLLSNKENKIFIKSLERGIGQHHVYSWMVSGTSFVRAEKRSDRVARMDKAILECIDGLSEDQRRNVAAAVFEAIEASGAKTLNDINENKWVSYNAIIKALKNLDEEKAKDLGEMLKSLASLSRDAIVGGAKATLENAGEKAQKAIEEKKKEHELKKAEKKLREKHQKEKV